jgi:hypothetical protein
MRRPLILVLVAALSGCGREEPPPERIHVPDSPYYPLKVGNAWHYKGKDGQMTQRVVRHEKVGARACALIETSRDKQVIMREHVHVTDDGLYRLSVEGRKLSRPLRILKLPPRPGEQWEATFQLGTTQGKGLYRMGEEEVVVPAGRYKAVTLTGEITEDGLRAAAFTYWFAEGVGIVKQSIRSGEQRKVYELEKFDLKK